MEKCSNWVVDGKFPSTASLPIDKTPACILFVYFSQRGIWLFKLSGNVYQNYISVKGETMQDIPEDLMASFLFWNAIKDQMFRQAIYCPASGYFGSRWSVNSQSCQWLRRRDAKTTNT
jgi:hypothetical protein